MDLLGWFLASLAVYRVSRMIAMERGPFDLFVRLRARYQQKPDNWLKDGLTCPLCLSFWFGLLAAIPLANNFYYWLIGGLAMSAVTVVVHRLIG